MTDLPWITPPQAPAQPTRLVGTEATGTLRIPILGGLTVEEDRIVNELTAEDVNAFVIGAQLAELIAQETGLSLVEAFSLVEDAAAGRPIPDEHAEVRIRHAAQLQRVANALSATGQRTIDASVTAVIRHRLDRPGWTMPAKFHRVLRNQIWQLIQAEQAAERLPASPVSEDDLGKPPGADGSGSEPTGDGSSGVLSTPSQGSSAAKRSAMNSAPS